ncbi:zinc finger, CCHC-type containing protein [Tanacetum coccineum]
MYKELSMIIVVIMAENTMKDMTTNFGKLDKFKGHDFRRWQKKMNFLLTTLKVVYVLTTPMPELVEDATVEAIKIRAKWENDDYICRGHILNGMSDSLFDVYTNAESAKGLWNSLESKILGQYTQHGLKMDESIFVSSVIDKFPPSWKDFKHTLKHGKVDLSLVQLGSHLRIEESLRAQDRDKGKGKEVGGPSVNMTEEGDAIAWWIDSGATTHVCKYLCWFKTYEPVEDGSALYMGDEHFAPIHGKGNVALEFRFGYYNNGMFMLNLNKVPNDSDYVYMSSSSVVNSSLWHARLGYVHYKRMLEMSKDDLIPAIDENLEKCTTCMLTKITRQPFKSITRKSVILELIHSDLCDFHATPSLGNKKYVITSIDDAYRFCYVYLLHAKNEALDKFRIYKTEVELQQNDLIKTLRTDRGGEYCDLVFFQSIGIIHETTAPYTPQQNGVAERKNRALKEMVNSMVPNKRNKTTPYELWYKKRPNLSFLRVWGCRAVVRLPDPKRKTLGEKGINCIFVGYAEHSKAYSFYVIEPNDSVSINSIIESRDEIFDENHFSSMPRPKDVIPNSDEPQKDDHSDDVPSETPEPRRDHNTLTAIVLRRILEPIMKLCPGFWKEAIDDEIGSIMDNNTWVLSDLPLGCKPLGCKWIFKRKMKGEGTIDKFKDRLNKGIVITQSYYIEKILKKFNREDCSPVSTLVDLVEKIKPNRGKPVDELEYSRAIGCLMYVMTSTRPDIAYAVGRLSRFIINPSRQHWHAITRVFKYLKGTMNYGLSYVGYPSVLEAYSDASWINHVEDSSSTSGWVFLLGGGSISWASKKQTCITGSTMESEFVALDAASKEVEWLRNFIHEIPIWLKPITLISIHCDSVATLAKASSQIYNGKSRHLGVRHSMVRELIMNGVISIEFVRSQHNLADHLMKGLARDLVTLKAEFNMESS